METLANLGTFFLGIGAIGLSAGLFWFVSLYEKEKKLNKKDEK